MKKVISVVLSLFLMTGLIACSGGETQTEGSIVSTTTETVAASETAESTTGTIETTVEETTESSIETTTVEETTEVSSATMLDLILTVTIGSVYTRHTVIRIIWIYT